MKLIIWLKSLIREILYESKQSYLNRETIDRINRNDLIQREREKWIV